MLQRVFLTGEVYTWWADLVWWITRVATGRVVVLAAGGDATSGLRHARTLFKHLGAIFVNYLGYNTVWSWAFVKGGRTLSEAITRGLSLTQMDYGPELNSNSVYTEGVVNLLRSTEPVTGSAIEHARWQYCAAHAVMGGLCDVVAPDPLPMPTPPPIANQTLLTKVPIIVTAGNRYQYLYHTLTTLLAAPGAIHHNILVVLGDASPSTTLLLRLLNLNFTTLPVHGHHNDKLFRYYRSVFNLVATTFPDAPAAIFLDEDVEVSPDFFSYFSQTLWLLNEDPTLYCINTYSLLPNMKRGRRSQYVQRGATQVFWGYAVPLSFVKEALLVWPDSTKHLDIHMYDFWLYDQVRGGRECVYPEVSRVRHYGVGLNINTFMHEYEAWRRPLLYDTHVPLVNTALMLLDAYESNFVHKLLGARVVSAEEACVADFPGELNKTGQPLVVYYRQDKQDDVSTWYLLGQCARLHPWAEQGNHAGAHIAHFPLTRTWHTISHFSHSLNKYGFNYYKTENEKNIEIRFQQVYYVGVPYSRYSYLRPATAEVFDVTSISDTQLNVLQDKLSDSLSILNITHYNYHTLIHKLFIHTKNTLST